MKITEKTIVTMLDKFRENNYQQDTSIWHCRIDVGYASQGPVSVETLMKIHDQPLKFYQDNLGELVEDGLITLKNEE